MLLRPAAIVIVCRMAKFGAGSLNLIPVFSFPPFKRNLFLMYSLAVPCRIYGLDLPTSLVIVGMRGAKAAVSPPRPSPPSIYIINTRIIYMPMFYFLCHKMCVSRSIFFLAIRQSICGMSFNADPSLVNNNSSPRKKNLKGNHRKQPIWTKSNSFLCLLPASLRSNPPTCFPCSILRFRTTRSSTLPTV